MTLLNMVWAPFLLVLSASMRRRLKVKPFLASREVGSLSAGTVMQRASDLSMAPVFTFAKLSSREENEPHCLSRRV
jgi:hypothetical protein